MLLCLVRVLLFLLSIVNSKNIKKRKKCDEITNAVVKKHSPQHSFYVLCLKKRYEEIRCIRSVWLDSLIVWII